MELEELFFSNYNFFATVYLFIDNIERQSESTFNSSLNMASILQYCLTQKYVTKKKLDKNGQIDQNHFLLSTKRLFL